MQIISTSDVSLTLLHQWASELDSGFEAAVDQGQVHLRSTEAPSWVTFLAEASWWTKLLAAYAALYVAEIVKRREGYVAQPCQGAECCQDCGQSTCRIGGRTRRFAPSSRSANNSRHWVACSRRVLLNATDFGGNGLRRAAPSARLVHSSSSGSVPVHIRAWPG